MGENIFIVLPRAFFTHLFMCFHEMLVNYEDPGHGVESGIHPAQNTGLREKDERGDWESPLANIPCSTLLFNEGIFPASCFIEGYKYHVHQQSYCPSWPCHGLSDLITLLLPPTQLRCSLPDHHPPATVFQLFWHVFVVQLQIQRQLLLLKRRD